MRSKTKHFDFQNIKTLLNYFSGWEKDKEKGCGDWGGEVGLPVKVFENFYFCYLKQQKNTSSNK